MAAPSDNTSEGSAVPPPAFSIAPPRQDRSWAARDHRVGKVHQVTPAAQWFGPEASARVAGQNLPGGMLYVGKGLPAPSAAIDPALVDPSLKVDRRSPDRHGQTMGYWPSYDSISPGARAAYLDWLAGGRRDPSAYIGYVFLYFYGLERRALIDIANDPSLRWELPHLRTEVVRLIDVYDNNYSFRNYATRFLDALELLSATDKPATDPPTLTKELSWVEPPLSLQIRLGLFAAQQQPVPADWALAWAWTHPDIHLRTAAHRCTTEFAALFAIRYAEQYGDGIVPSARRPKLKFDYRPASAGMRNVSLAMNNAPDVFGDIAVVKKLAALVDSVTTELDPYSRFLGRNPEGRAALAGVALLPAGIAGEATGELAVLRDWATDHAETSIPTTGADLFAQFPVKSPNRMAKQEAVTLAQLLERFQLGLEPDVRLGGPAITPDATIVVFCAGDQPPRTATPAYAAATTLLHLAVAVSAADGHVSPEENTQIVNHLQRSLELSAGERLRLVAHLRWLETTGVKLTGLKKRVEVLDRPQRSAIGDLLVAVAAADGVISPEEVTSLTKIFTLLDLDPGEVHTRLHAHLTRTRPAPATAPVSVLAAGEADAGYAIHEPAPGLRDPSLGVLPAEVGGGKHRADAAAPAFAGLDLAALEAKFAETAAAASLLTEIFTDEPDQGSQPGGASPPSSSSGQSAAPLSADQGSAETGPVVAGLDPAHSNLLRVLLGRATWSRPDLEDLAATFNLMPDGAVDRINEAALDACDEPLLDEEDDEYVINDYARQELAS